MSRAPPKEDEVRQSADLESNGDSSPGNNTQGRIGTQRQPDKLSSDNEYLSNLLIVGLLHFSVVISALYRSCQAASWQIASAAGLQISYLIVLAVTWSFSILYVLSFHDVTFAKLVETHNRYVAQQQVYKAIAIIGMSIFNCLHLVEVILHHNHPSLTENMLVILFFPLLVVFALHEHRVGVFLATWMIALGTYIFAVAMNQVAFGAAPAVFVYLAASPFLLLNTIRRHQITSSVHLQLATEVSNLKLQLANQESPSELRHLIANVAHDLKTPLSSFMVGTELIKAEVDKLQDSLRHPPHLLAANPWRESLSTVYESLRDIKDTNTFMLMTINRCIEYAKTTGGGKLLPKNETIILDDTLRLPIVCMRNVQARIRVELHPVPPEICSHVVTDEQWLQENILCLLSNAAKYSNGGLVSVKLSCIARKDTIPSRPSSSPQSVASSEHSSQDHSPRTSSFLGRMSQVQPDVSSVSTLAFVRPPNNAQESSHSVPIQEQTLVPPSSAPAYQPADLQDMILVEVEDQGIGVPEDAVAHLFNPFRQTQKMAGGTGLGLYSLAKRVEALKGDYGVRPRRDGTQGSCFWFTIPYRPDDLAASCAVDFGSGVGSNSEKRETSPTLSGVSPEAGPKSVRGQGMFSLTKANSDYAWDATIASLSSATEGDSSLLLSSSIWKRRASFRESVQISHEEPFHPVADIERGLSSMQSDMTTNASAASSFSLRSLGVSTTAAADSNSSPRVRNKGKTPTGSTASAASTSPAAVRSLNILLVEDSATISKVQMKLLDREGHRVTLAENGAIAVRLVEESMPEQVQLYSNSTLSTMPSVRMPLEVSNSNNSEEKGDFSPRSQPPHILLPTQSDSIAFNSHTLRCQYDLILMDFQMPVMDGLEAIKRIRAFEEDPSRPQCTPRSRLTTFKAPVSTSDSSLSAACTTATADITCMRHTIVGLTANCDEETIKEGYASGMDDFLAKPFTADSFRDLLQRVLKVQSD